MRLWRDARACQCCGYQMHIILRDTTGTSGWDFSSSWWLTIDAQWPFPDPTIPEGTTIVGIMGGCSRQTSIQWGDQRFPIIIHRADLETT